MRPLHPQGTLPGHPARGFVPELVDSRLPSIPRPRPPPGPGCPSPRPVPPADLSRCPGRRPPGGRARGRRAPGEPPARAPPSKRTSFPRKAGTRRAAQVAAIRPASPGRVSPRCCPPDRGSARPAAAVPRQWSGSRGWSRGVGGSERGSRAAPRPRWVLVPRVSRVPSASVLEADQKATSLGTDLVVPRHRTMCSVRSLSRKLVIKEETATSSASSPLPKLLTCKGG